MPTNRSRSGEAVSPSKARTGIRGLDEILRGGLPRNRVYLLDGLPGSGKTSLAMMFLLEGLAEGERCLYITMSESLDEIIEVGNSHGWDLSRLDIFDVGAVDHILAADTQNTVFETSSVELGEAIALLIRKVEACRPNRVVIDSVSELHLLSGEPWIYRLHLLRLKQILFDHRVTTLIVNDGGLGNDGHDLRGIVHGVISVGFFQYGQGAIRRSLCVHKLRGVPFMEGEHDLRVVPGGVEVFPRLVAVDPKWRERSVVVLSTGVKELDDILGGGLDEGTTNLVIGPVGVGKSTIAMQFALHAVESGERVGVYLFDEHLETVVRRWDGLGRNIRPMINQRLLDIRDINPAQVTAGEFANEVRRAVEDDKAKVIVIDSLSAYQNAMMGKWATLLQFHELQLYLAKWGVVTVIVHCHGGLVLPMLGENFELSYLADTMVLLRYYEYKGAVRRALSVFKRRTGRHETTIRDFEIGPRGLVIGPPLTGFQGVLTGNLVYALNTQPASAVAERTARQTNEERPRDKRALFDNDT